MPGITLADAEAQLATWLTASTNLSKGRSVSVDGQSVTMADTIEQITFWENKVQALTAAAASTKYSPFNHTLAKFT